MILFYVIIKALISIREGLLLGFYNRICLFLVSGPTELRICSMLWDFQKCEGGWGGGKKTPKKVPLIRVLIDIYTTI